MKRIEPKNIIIRMPNWIGDFVMATPILSDMRRAFPKASITAMCRIGVCQLLEMDPDIDEIFCFSKSSGFNRRDRHRDLIEKIRQGKYDLGILLTNSFSSSWWFYQGHISYRIGYRGNFRSFLLTHPVNRPSQLRKQHLVKTYKMLLSALGIPVSKTEPRLYLAGREIQAAKELVKRQGVQESDILIGINPAAAYGSAKCWMPERFTKVAHKLLQNEKIHLVFFGDQESESLVKGICRTLPERAINLAGLTSLRELAGLISLCRVFLSNDSGPMHIADALQVPVVALFGSTNEIVTGPFSQGRVIHKHVVCSPCYKRTCPIDFRCMRAIEVEEVYQQVVQALFNQPS
ncbi:lipopolysaccharide heptosyltransferase II [Candidatus Rhabdochlamydia porcellionis]|uniref:lipopolysaccharide heptosyltransferase II n=1 Tax=Candidatus Rhabdochlamydia porcellionis TaxID=225148 RepID=A0ABX8Z385_9BACT|nr:lipopolysaccharide heptosyltransferase II [Candidatus Rhabdochlamydia porcellionis]QZA59363.1 ADP-heptose--LPS heptosyltransferase 2 [Candidatus Rhabdochlamydia porcellionis]